MMMEDSGDDNGSVDNTGDLNDDTEISNMSNPPSFAMPPGGEGVSDSNDSLARTSSSISDSRSMTPPPPSLASEASAPAPNNNSNNSNNDDPFDFLSMTTAPVPSTANDVVNDFDVFAAQPTISGSLIGNNDNNIVDTKDNTQQDQDFLGVSTMPSPSIDINSKKSMIDGAGGGGGGNGMASPDKELKTAESGDLLGLAGEDGASATTQNQQNQTPDDFMDDSFQTMPFSAPATTVIDPFAMDSSTMDLNQQHLQPLPLPLPLASPPVTNDNDSTKNNNKLISSKNNIDRQEEQQFPEKIQQEKQEVKAPKDSNENINESNTVEKDGETQQKQNNDVSKSDINKTSAAENIDVPFVGTSMTENEEDKRKSLPKQEELSSERAATVRSDAPSNEESQTTDNQADDTITLPAQSEKMDDVCQRQDESAPGTPSQPKDVYEDSTAFEEVELASPQNSSSQDQDAVVISKDYQEAALQMKNLKPPLLDGDEQSAEEEKAVSTLPSSEINEAQQKKIRELEDQLSKAQQEIENLHKQKEQYEKQQNDRQMEMTNVLQELQDKLQEQVSQRAEAENDASLANVENKKLKTTLQTKEGEWEKQTAEWKEQLSGLEKENEALIAKAKHELEDRKEHERRERVLANKLNMLKKKQATTTDVEEIYEDDLRLLKDEVASKTKQVEELEASKAALEEQLEHEKAVSKTRIEQLEKTVREEKSLNEERKKKMKAFIEAKSEELKEAKAESENYQNELNQTNQSMVDLNNRWKTLHAQWVQSQTRNRELQRDLNKIKNDSENLHKVGDSLNVKLSRSANEIDQHKSKRLAAKQELMSVLGQLEAEREITNKLRDSVRFTFTPKAQSQHQLLQENLTEFRKQLEELARRLGRPIPLPNDANSHSLSSLVMSAVEESERSEKDDDNLSSPSNETNGGRHEKGGGASKEQKRILLETTRLLAKLENETQRISQGIMSLTSNIEEMNKLIQGGGEKTCFTSLGSIFFGGGLAKAIEADRGNRNGGTGSSGPVRYGHSSHLPTETGTMT